MGNVLRISVTIRNTWLEVNFTFFVCPIWEDLLATRELFPDDGILFGLSKLSHADDDDDGDDGGGVCALGRLQQNRKYVEPQCSSMVRNAKYHRKSLCNASNRALDKQ